MKAPGKLDQRDGFGMCAAPSSEWEAIAKRESVGRHEAERKAARYRAALMELTKARNVLSIKKGRCVDVCIVCGYEDRHSKDCVIGKALNGDDGDNGG